MSTTENNKNQKGTINNTDAIKPFTVNITSGTDTKITPTAEVKREAPTPGTIIRDGVQMEQPFTTIDTPKSKIYLILKVYNDTDAGEGESEQIRDFEFFTGTSQELYDKIREEILESDDSSVRQKIDVMKSMVLVNSNKITIGVALRKDNPCSMYRIMKNLREQGKVVDETSFDIDDYKYDFDMESEN